jgi:hypothetical protein
MGEQANIGLFGGLLLEIRVSTLHQCFSNPLFAIGFHDHQILHIEENRAITNNPNSTDDKI